MKPALNTLTKFPFARVGLDAELSGQAKRPKEWDSFKLFGLMASPCEPSVEIKAARTPGEHPNHLRVHRNRMLFEFLPELR